MTTTTPVFLLAPAPGMIFAAAPSGWNYTADKNGIIVVTNGSVADIQALVGEGCTVLSPSVQYTDLNYTTAVACATTTALPANSYANGTAGVGATLTGSSNGALAAIDGVTPTAGMRLWIKNEASAANNGIYVVTQVGGASTPYILMRSTDANTAALLGNLAAFVTGGAANIGNTYAVPLSFGAITIGTTAISPVQVNGPQGVASETARAEAAEAGLMANASPAAANLVNDVIFPDDPYYAGGIFDGSGNPLFGLLPNGAVNGVVTVPPQAVGDDAVWPDDISNIAGDIGLADMNGNLVFPVTDAHINSLASAQVAIETLRAEAAETTLTTNTASNADAIAILQTLQNDVIFPDDPYYAGGIFDGSGNPLFGLLPNGASNGVVSVPPQAIGDDPVWPDDVSTIEGDIGLADMNGNLLFPLPTSLISSTASSVVASTIATAITVNLPSEDQVWPDDVSNIAGDIGLADVNGNLLDYRWARGAYNAYVAYIDSASYVCALGPTSTPDVPIASARGSWAATPAPAICGLGQPDTNNLLKWMDDGTADGFSSLTYPTPNHEARLFNFAGAAAVTAISGINKIVFIPMIGQSLSNGTTAAVLTSSNVFSRAFMFNGGPMPYQEYNSAFPAPGILCSDSQLQTLVELVEVQQPGGFNGETYGGGISYWMGQSSNLESTSVMVFATLGQGGANIDQMLQVGTSGATSGTMFASVIRCAERVAAWCKLNGLTLEIPCVVMDQGENDYTTAGSTYLSALTELQSQLNTALGNILTKIGQTPQAQLKLLMMQPSSWSFYSYTTAPNIYEQLAAVVANPTKFAVVGPQYYIGNYNSASGQHQTAEGYRLDGEYTGRAIEKLRAGSSPPALYATSVSNSGTTITITFNASTQLVHDTSIVSDPNGQWGIRLLNGSGSNVALSGFSIVGTNQIQCTAASSISGQSCMLGIADYAYGTLGQVCGPTISPRAPIRDSATDVSSSVTGSTPMYNYACHQQIVFTGN